MARRDRAPLGRGSCWAAPRSGGLYLGRLGRRRPLPRVAARRVGARRALLRHRAALRRGPVGAAVGGVPAAAPARRVHRVDQGRPAARDGPDEDTEGAEGFYGGRPQAAACATTAATACSRSLEESLERLGLDRVDTVYVHDPDDYVDEAVGEACPALDPAARRGRRPARRGRDEPRRRRCCGSCARRTSTQMHGRRAGYTLLDQSAGDEPAARCATSAACGWWRRACTTAACSPTPGRARTTTTRRADAATVERAARAARALRGARRAAARGRASSSRSGHPAVAGRRGGVPRRGAGPRRRPHARHAAAAPPSVRPWRCPDPA